MYFFLMSRVLFNVNTRCNPYMHMQHMHGYDRSEIKHFSRFNFSRNEFLNELKSNQIKTLRPATWSDSVHWINVIFNNF